MDKLQKITLTAPLLLALANCASPTAQRSPIDIASQSVRRVDPINKRTEIVAPDVTLRTKGNRVKANARLITAGNFTDSKGIRHKDGAFLDVAIAYKTATSLEREGRYYDQVAYPGGQFADLADFGETVLYCEDEYIPNYSSFYGNYGYYGYGYGYGYGYDALGYYWGQWYDGWRRPKVIIVDEDGDDDNGTGDVDDGDVTPTPPVQPRPRRPDVRDPDYPRPPLVRPSVVRPRPFAGATPKKRVVYEPRTPNKSLPIRRPMDRPISRPQVNDTAIGGFQRGNGLARDLGREQGAALSAYRAIPVRGGDRTRPTIRPNGWADGTPTSTNSRPAPQPRSTSRSSSRSSTRSSHPVDRAFRETDNSRTNRLDTPKPALNYYSGGLPGYIRPSYTVRHECKRQENLRVFIPKSRIEAAQETGLVVYLQPRASREQTLKLPPNYLQGFYMAAYTPLGERLALREPMRPTQKLAHTQAPKRKSAVNTPKRTAANTDK